MDADAQTPEAPSSPPRSARSRPSSWSSSEYTSLRDVLTELGHGGGGGGSSSDVHDFDTSNIPIRNQLLKHAASAYLQSAIVVTPRDRGCLSRAWRRRCRVLLRPCPGWECDVDVDVGPVRRCAAALAGSARRVLACLCGCVACAWT
ncbi:uncharacterized protein LOC123452114 [Hordeum vulgare subsp. vulgare]|uniref:Uncharacterized protein n=1 Tax=Hordeum vulgare subsp. vulgare TaxID=112509 RepID=A0A8I6XW81_HORVV|nr:uncharacterized protein LOC123452114 [Hordeum vulgare subsp. vulgare]KAI4984694.1 hypothetical protein ZWY2020_017324 [Hordeum vulgare]